jgi:hypothetical protein
MFYVQNQHSLITKFLHKTLYIGRDRLETKNLNEGWIFRLPLVVILKKAKLHYHWNLALDL